MTTRAIAALIAAFTLLVIAVTTVQAVQRSGIQRCNAEDHPSNLPCLFITEEGRDFYVDENGSAYHLDTFEQLPPEE